MNFYRSNVFWTLSAIALPALLIAGYYGFKVMTSVYKQDLGNGVIIYADNFVKTGKWVFDCNNSRLISREPLPAPISVLEGTGQLTIGDMYTLEDADREQADAAIRAITGIEGWYKNLRYRYSSLNESSNLNVHNFDLLARISHDRINKNG